MLIEIVRHTPAWVFALLAGLVWLGIRRSRPGEVSRGQLLAVPVAMTGLSLAGLAQSFGADVVAIVAWTTAYGAMLALSLGRPPRNDVQYSSASKRFRVPGSWLPLALMMTIFFTRYAVAVTLVLQPALSRDTGFVAAVGLVYGLLSGGFAARAAMTWRSASRRLPASLPAAVA